MTTTLTSSLNTALWVAAWILAVIFAAAGLMKIGTPKEKLIAAGMGWVGEVDPKWIRLLGLAELAGAIGIIVPPLVHIAPWLAPLAAVGLALVMIGAIVTNARERQWLHVVVNVVLLALAVFVAWGRYRLGWL